MSDLINDLQNKKSRLGRGLGSLLNASSENQNTESVQKASLPIKNTIENPVKETSLNTENRVWNLDIEKITTSEFQPREIFNKETLNELSESIKLNGIIQPIIVRKTLNNKFEIVAGERRWRAAQLAGKKEIPVIIKTLSNKETLELAIIENVQREDLNSIEEARAYSNLMQNFNLTQLQVAEKVGKDRTTIANALRLLTLPLDVIQLIQENSISQGHAKSLLSLNNKEQISKIAKKIIKDGLSVRKLETLIKETNKSIENQPGEELKNERKNLVKLATQKLTEELQRELGTKVTIDYHNAKGKITIHFYSDEELNEITNRIRG